MNLFTVIAVVIAVIVVVVLAVAFSMIRQKNREADIARAEELRTQAATQAQSTLPPAQDEAAEAQARAEEASLAAERARAEAEEARIATPPSEADRGAVTSHEPTSPATDEAPADETTAAGTAADGTPLLPRRTPGANEMPGRPMEGDGAGGGWFTRKGSDQA